MKKKRKNEEREKEEEKKCIMIKSTEKIEIKMHSSKSANLNG